MTIPPNCPTPSGLSKGQTVSLRALPKGLVGTDRLGAPTASQAACPSARPPSRCRNGSWCPAEPTLVQL